MFVPAIIAFSKEHPYKWAILLVSTVGSLLGGIGWLVGLVWCYILPSDTRRTVGGVADEIDRLHQLKERGALSQNEFDAGKKKVLEGSIAEDGRP